MAGRPTKPKPSPNRGQVLDKLYADLTRYQETLAREVAQQRSGQRLPKPMGR